VAGGAIAIWARDSRVVAAGLVLSLIAAIFTSPSTPGTLTVALRIIGAMLAGYLIVLAAGSRSVSSEGSAIGPLAEAGLAATLFCVGWWAAPVVPLAGSTAAQAAGIALVGIAVVPLLGRDIFRLGIAATALILGLSLLLDAWTGTAPALQQLLITGLLVCVAGVTSLLMSPSPAPRVAPAAPEGAAPDAADEPDEPDESTSVEVESPAEEKPEQSVDAARLRSSPGAERQRLRSPRP